MNDKSFSIDPVVPKHKAWEKHLTDIIVGILISKSSGAKVWSEEAAALIVPKLWESIGEVLLEFDNKLNWGVDTAVEAHYLDKLYALDMRREQAERKLDAIRQSILIAAVRSLSDQGASE